MITFQVGLAFLRIEECLVLAYFGIGTKLPWALSILRSLRGSLQGLVPMAAGVVLFLSHHSVLFTDIFRTLFLSFC